MLNIDLNTSVSQLQNYLTDVGWLLSNENILSTTKAGEGNMNVVLRITTDQRSLILKQSRPFVQKYQQIPAPLERIIVEHQFYIAVHKQKTKAHFPDILGFHPQEYLLLMEDLGRVDDMTRLYSSRKIPQDQLDKLIEIAADIHSSIPKKKYPLNTALRALNHQHIFILPFTENSGFDLDEVQEGLDSLSMSFKSNRQLKKVISTLGDQYLNKGNTLIHGDYYPGSWMATKEQVFVIDPEFSFMGFAEFDLGVMAAHLVMGTMDIQYLTTIAEKYPFSVDPGLIRKMAGAEIIRRLIGLAQLPMTRTIEEKEYLLMEASKMILR